MCTIKVFKLSIYEEWISIFPTEAKRAECREFKVSALLNFCSDTTTTVSELIPPLYLTIEPTTTKAS